MAVAVSVHLHAPQMSVRRAFALQVLPGVPMALVFLMAARLYAERGLPVPFALYTAILIGEVPATWALMLRERRREGGGPLFPWRARLAPWQYVAFGVPLVLVSLVLMGALTTTLGEALRVGLFDWLPSWAVMDMNAPVTDLSSAASAALVLLALVSGLLVGGVTQELFARGFLLPRTSDVGRAAPAFNAAAFAVLHLVSPWSWPVFFVVALAWSYAVWWKRSLALGLIGHIGMLSIMSVGMIATVAGWV